MTYRILYLNSTSQIGGAEMSLLQLLAHLDKEMFQPIVVLPGCGPLVDRLNELNVETVTTSVYRLRIRNPIPFVRAAVEVGRIITKERVDLIHSNNTFCNPHAVICARIKGVPSVCHVRHLVTRIFYWEKLMPLADVLIANSRATANSFRPYVRRSQKVEVIYNALDIEQFRASTQCIDFREELAINNKTFILGLVSRINLEKGHHVLIKALSRVVKSYPDVLLLIIGGTSVDSSETYLERLKALVGELQLKSKVKFIGYVSQVVRVYQAIDLLVLPALWEEPFGRCFIEAMAMGKPVVASRVGGVPEVVIDKVTGLLVPPNAPDSLADAILKLIHDRKLAQSMGEKGRERVQQKFSIEGHMAAIEAVYQSLLVTQ